MSDNQPVSTLSTYTAKTWATGETIDASDLGDGATGEFVSIDSLLDEIKNLAADIQNHRAGATAPTDNAIAGQVWYETDTKRPHLDPDGSGADEPLSRVQKVDLTENSAGGAAGTLTSYSIPASTLAAAGKVLRITCWGTRSGSAASLSIQPRLATNAIGTAFDLATSETSWRVVVLVASTGTDAQDAFWEMITIGNSDADFEAYTEDDGSAITFDLNVSSINAADDVTQQGMVVEILN